MQESKRNQLRVVGLLYISSVLAIASPLIVQAQDVSDLKQQYTKDEYMIPMRDGVKLYTQVYSPKDQSQKYPILMTRTPYSVGNYGPDNFRSSLGPFGAFAREGYIVAYQDVRGKFRSEGQFFHHPPYIVNKKSPKDVDESSDCYDTFDWLLKNHPGHNGRVGLWGVSAAGYTTAKGMIDAHPALKAASPQAAPGDQFIGDDYHHYGGFRLMYAFSWTSANARIRSGPTEERPKPFDYGTPDGHKFFLDLGPISNVNTKYFKDQVPTWTEFVNHPNYDEYWQGKNVMKDMRNINFAVLNVIGWFDDQDYYGPWGIYKSIEKLNPNNKSTVVVGPWSHGGWGRSDGDQLGNIRFGSKTAEYFRNNVELPFFNYYLKDKGDWKSPEALVFLTGSNEWKSYDQWPPGRSKQRNLYLQPNGKLSFNPPSETSENAYDSFVSDPNKPVPFTAEITTRQGPLWIVEDQRFVASRPDVLVYQTDVLTEDVTIAGSIIADLFVSTTGTDADWIVKLIDVYPGDAPDNQPNPSNIRMGDFQMMLAGEVFRSKYRKSFTKPEPVVPNEVTKIEFDLLDKHHTFLKGHRIMIQIQSTWFPLIDRNPQKFVNTFQAKESDFQKATHKVYRSAKYPTYVKLNLPQ
jgi:putative CocE/NonD family hydrolase